METASVDHHGQETAYRHRDTGGRGPTLPRAHSSDGAYGAWCGQPRLANDYLVATLDLNDHGDSDDVDADVGYGILLVHIDDVATTAEETDASVLAGNSFSGAVILTLALERDLNLDAFIFAGTGAKLVVLSDLLDWLKNDFDCAISLPHGEDKLLYTDDGRLVKGSKKVIYDAGQAVTPRNFLSCHIPDVYDEVSEISVPMLVLIGEYDRLTSSSYHEYLAGTVSDGELETVEGTAHLAVPERPAAFNEAVKLFLDRRAA